MYKVAIIDDEPLIVEGLSKTMAWEKWNCQVAGYAFDGREGMELIRKERPDIIITDINMPKMDGLKMIAGLKSEFPDIQLIILTGYREFEYAHKAIRFGVFDYLLKPISPEKLERCMKPILRNIKGSYHVYRTKTEIIKIPYNKILAFTSFRHYVDILTESNDNEACYRQKITLKNLQNELPKEFVRCHRTIIININKAMKLTCKDITLTDNSVYPVSESYLEHVRKAFSALLDT